MGCYFEGSFPGWLSRLQKAGLSNTKKGIALGFIRSCSASTRSGANTRRPSRNSWSLSDRSLLWHPGGRIMDPSSKSSGSAPKRPIDKEESADSDDSDERAKEADLWNGPESTEPIPLHFLSWSFWSASISLKVFVFFRLRRAEEADAQDEPGPTESELTEEFIASIGSEIFVLFSLIPNWFVVFVWQTEIESGTSGVCFFPILFMRRDRCTKAQRQVRIGK